MLSCGNHLLRSNCDQGQSGHAGGGRRGRPQGAADRRESRVRVAAGGRAAGGKPRVSARCDGTLYVTAERRPGSIGAHRSVSSSVSPTTWRDAGKGFLTKMRKRSSSVRFASDRKFLGTLKDFTAPAQRHVVRGGGCAAWNDSIGKSMGLIRSRLAHLSRRDGGKTNRHFIGSDCSSSSRSSKSIVLIAVPGPRNPTEQCPSGTPGTLEPLEHR